MTVIEAHDLGVLSYSNDAPQSLPNKPFEYLAYGAALISNLDGELKTITADNSIGFHFSNKAELLALLEDLLNNPEKTRRARKNATTYFKNQCSADTIYTDLTSAHENQASYGRLDPSQDA